MRAQRDDNAPNVLRLGGQAYRIESGSLEGLLERRCGQVVRMRDHKRCAVRLGGRSLHDELLALRRGSRVGSELPRVVSSGKDRVLGHFLVTSWLGDGPNAEQQAEAERHGGQHVSAEMIYHRFLPLLRSLQRLHDIAQIVHGDVSLQNLVLVDGKRYALIDYGFAFPTSRTTRRSLDRGTPGYAPPEQWHQRGVIDFRADQFAASAAAYRLLTGRFPHGDLGGMQRNLASQPGPPSAINPTVWPALDDVITRALSLDAEARFPTTREWLLQWQAAAPKKTRISIAGMFRSWWCRTRVRFTASRHDRD